MTVELVTGHAGTGHIDGFDVGGLIGGIAGDGDYVLQEPYGTISCTVKDNNHVIIGKGDLIMSGRHVRIEDPETLTVQSGTQGQHRHDLVVMRYSRQSSGIETAELQVLRGKPGSSSIPGYNTGSILNGATTRDMPLYRLDLNGISLNTSPARLFSTFTPVSAITPNLSNQINQSRQSASDQIRQSEQNLNNKINQTQQDLNKKISQAQQERAAGDRANANAISDEQAARRKWDQVNSADISNLTAHVGKVEGSLNSFKSNFEVLQFRKLVSDTDAQISGIVVNGVAFISLRWTNRGGFHIGAWSSDHPFAEITNGWKTSFETGNWSVDNSAFNDCWFSLNGNRIIFRSRSAHDIAANTWHLCQIIAPVHK